MDRVDHYRCVVARLIKDYASVGPANGLTTTEAVLDRDGDHYMAVNVGWDGVRRVYGSVIHLDIIDGKIWVQHDATSIVVAEELLDAGIPKEDIVLGFQPENVRQYTDFAVG